MGRLINRIFIAMIGAAIIAACATVPYTKRHQFNLVSEGEETQLGVQAYDEVLKATPRSSNQDYQRMVQDVGNRIKTAANEPKYDWQFTVLKSTEVNAWCLPGGKVAFYEAIMPICKDENGVAVVMGHEVAHALAHHGAERMSQTMGAQLVGDVLAVGLGKADPAVRQNVLNLYGVGAQVGVMLPFNRKQESEADHIGLILMAKAGFDPHGAIAFWTRMESQSQGQKPPAFLSTHPTDQKRIEQIQKWMPEAMSYYTPR